jgi:predicted RNA-binding Zn-ribbon protein involved in translation (DUF1610 family)
MKLLQDLRDVFKTLKRRAPAKIYCPCCGSPKIRLSTSLEYWLTPKKYLCENCGYTGPVVMELEKEESDGAVSV